MKILKLLGIFIILVGGIFLALNWNTLFDDGSAPEIDMFADEDQLDISEQCDDIRKAWAAEKGWNEELYKEQRADIDQSKNMKLFSKAGFNTVNNCLREEATNKACDGYMDALHASNFSDAALKKAYKGVTDIKTFEELDNEPRVEKVVKLNKLYTDIATFVKSNHTITPNFKSETGEWTSFASLQNGILSKARTLRGNPLFSEMSNVPGFAAGLDESSLKSKTNAQRKGFYQKLSAQIVSYFNSEEATEEKIELLKQVYNRFTSQESNYGVTELARLKVNYGK